MSIEKIKNLIIEINELKHQEYRMRKSNKYKCENYDTYEEDYDEVYNNLINTRKLFIDECNSFVDYPKETFLFFDFTKKIKFKDERFIGLLLKVPFIDKKEYFCLINLFENMVDYMFKWSSVDDEEWMFK